MCWGFPHAGGVNRKDEDFSYFCSILVMWNKKSGSFYITRPISLLLEETTLFFFSAAGLFGEVKCCFWCVKSDRILIAAFNAGNYMFYVLIKQKWASKK